VFVLDRKVNVGTEYSRRLRKGYSFDHHQILAL
jgi:hypothetical protein